MQTTTIDQAAVCDNPADNATPCGINPSLTSAISPDGTPELGRRYEVAARQGRAADRGSLGVVQSRLPPASCRAARAGRPRLLARHLPEIHVEMGSRDFLNDKHSRFVRERPIGG